MSHAPNQFFAKTGKTEMSQEAPIGLIAGQGEFPLLFANAAMSLGKKVIAFGIKDCADHRIEAFGFGDLLCGPGRT